MKTTIVLFITIALAGCTKNTLDPNMSPKTDYCPMVVGSWIDYDVTVITIDTLTKYYDTVRYIMREEVDALLDSSANDLQYRIIRKTKLPNQLDWQEHDAILVIKNDHSLIRQENNIPEISISYPATVQKQWRGYALASDDTTKFSISQIGSQEVFAGRTFDSVMTVVHQKFVTLIGINDHSEQFAAGVGLVEKHRIDVKSGEPNVLGSDGKPIPVMERIVTASIFRQTYLAQGKK